MARSVVSEDIGNFFAVIPWLLIGVFILLSGITFLFLLIGKYNAWIGVFFVWVSLFAFYLMFNTFFTITSSGDGSGSAYGVPIQIGLFIFDLYLVLSTLGNLVGKRADIISKKIKYINSDAIIIWLIFSKATYEFLNAFPEAGVSTIKSVGVFLLFVPLFFFMGLRGIYKYSEIKDRRIKKKREKKRKKKALPSNVSETKSKNENQEIVYCSRCGAPNGVDSAFCNKCGHEL
ncbi:MAG: zinc ribbon domain-containing protein [Promethearchaeia archaeon]